MIDLSFLTEAEQEAILKVLNRDSELKKAEEERVKHLQDVVDDENEYKYKSGQWFYEAKSKRHRDKIHGAELVRASIRKRKKPTTLAELSELNKDSSKRRWVNSVNQDIFIPPELYGVMEAPDEAEEDVKPTKQEGSQSSKKVSFSSPEKTPNNLRNGTLSPPKSRQNPFNSEVIQDNTDFHNEAPSTKPDDVQINGTEKPKSGEEPLYAVVKKTPAASSPSQQQDFDLDDALREPRFHGQRGKTPQNIYLNEKPLEFGKSFSGEGKITFESSYPNKTRKESYSEELTPEKARKTEMSYNNVGEDPVAATQDDHEPVESIPLWRRPFMIENQEPGQSSPDLTMDQKTSKKILQESPGVGVEAQDIYGKYYPKNKTSPAPGEYSKETPYKSIFLQNRYDEHKPIGLTTDLPAVPNVYEPSRTGQLDKSLLRENRGRQELPKSAHFNVMSLKDRMNEIPKEQMSNPSQFQSIKHFWNVEEKNLLRGTTVTSPDKILMNVSSKSKPNRIDVKQRSSEIPADEVIFPNTLDNLSEEEQTSQKVASWLAQTPPVDVDGQMEKNEDPVFSGEEIAERIQKSTIHKKPDEDFANALQKLREEALEDPKITERSRTEVQMVPDRRPELVERKQTTITISPASQNPITVKATDFPMPDRGFYERVLQKSNKSPAKESLNVESKSKPFEENTDDTVVPERSTSNFSINFEKLDNAISHKEVLQESTLPSKESEAEEVIERSAVPKSRDQQDFFSSLKKLEIEASQPPLSDVESDHQDGLPEEEIRQYAVSPVKSSYKSGFEQFGAPTVELQPQHSYVTSTEPRTEKPSELEETVEKSTVPSRKENEDLSIALRKLELEAAEPHSDEEFDAGINQEVEPEKPKSQLSVQTNLPQDHSDIDLYSRHHEKSVDEQPPEVFSYGLKTNTFEEPGKSPVAEEPIEKTSVESQESAGDFHKRLLLLEEQAKIPEEPEDLLVDDAVKVSQVPNREVVISKKVYSSIESIPTPAETTSEDGRDKDTDSQWSKPKDLDDIRSHDSSHYKELAKYPQSPEPSGSNSGIGNMLYKKPEVGSPEVSKSKPGMDESHPILSALKRSEAKMLNSKAVQEVSPTSTNQLNSSIPTEDTPVNSFPQNADTLKRLSQSVPTFLQDETDGRDTDSASESSFQIGRHKKSPSSLTNLSGSSGMASMSSVSGSVMSIYSGDFGNVDIKGAIEFSVEYVEQLKEFLIYIYQCKDLAAAEVKKQRSDPYVKAYLLPEKAKMGKRKTAVKKKTLNPVYNEILRYKIPKQSLMAQTLNLSVWHHDALGRNSFLGEVNVDLGTWDWSNSHVRRWYQLEPRTPAAGMGLENRGEMKLSLKYVPMSPSGPKPSTTGEVYIWIKDCLQLPMLRENKINSFVKCTVLPDTSRKSRQKTRTVDKTPNPIFNHTMVYDGFKEEDLREACVELTVWDHNRLSNHFLGGLRIGLGTGKSYGTAVDWMDSTHEETTMWEKMMASPNTWVEGMLPLRMFKMAKLTK